jgi:hypothetical protein
MTSFSAFWRFLSAVFLGDTTGDAPDNGWQIDPNG